MQLIPLAILATFMLACSSAPSHDEQLRTREEVLRSACPSGSSLRAVSEALRAEGVPFTVMPPAQCHRAYVEVLGQPEACAGGSRIDAQAVISRTWVGFETSLLVTYLFNAEERLRVAHYRPHSTWL